MEPVEQVGDLVVDVLGAVVGVEGLDGEGEGGDEAPEDGDEEVLGDARHGSKVLELRHFVDDVDDVESFLAVAVAGMDGINAQEAGLAVRAGLAADADGHRGRPRLAEGRAPETVLAPLAEVVDVAVGDGGEAGEALVAEVFVLAPEDHLGSGSGELAEGLVHLGQQGGVEGRVAALEGVGRGLPAVVADVAAPAVLPDEAVDLCPGEAGRLLEEPPHKALVGLPEAVVLEPDQRAPDARVGRVTVGELDVDLFVALQEGADVVEGADPFGAKCHDHPPMISSPRTSGSFPAGNRLRVQAHLPLDKTSVVPK